MSTATEERKKGGAGSRKRVDVFLDGKQVVRTAIQKRDGGYVIVTLPKEGGRASKLHDKYLNPKNRKRNKFETISDAQTALEAVISRSIDSPPDPQNMLLLEPKKRSKKNKSSVGDDEGTTRAPAV